MIRTAKSRFGRLVLAVVAGLGLLVGAGVSPAVAAPGDLAPLYLTNSFGADPMTQRVFSWETPLGYSGPTVEVVPDGGAFSDAAIFTGTSAPVPAIVQNRVAQRVTVTGLAPGTTYAYRLGNTLGGARVFSATYRFTTAPATATFTFVHVTDSQCPPAGYATYWGPTLRAALATVPDAAFVLHTGDIVDTPDQAQWDAFFDATSDALSEVAFQPALGNHEGTDANNVAFYQSLFGVDSQNGFPLNYSFTYGNALFLVLNSNYTSAAELARQADWIRSVVGAQGSGKFIIAAFHKGPFGSFHVAEADVQRIKADLVPVLEEVGVSLVLQGHDHEYYRTYPIRDGAPVTSIDPGAPVSTRDDGVVFLSSKSAGAKVYPALQMPWFATHWTPPSVTDPADTVFTAITVGADALRITAYTSGGQIIDTATIYRGAVPAAALAMYRLYNPITGEHFYTASAEEAQIISVFGDQSGDMSHGCSLVPGTKRVTCANPAGTKWTYEGIGFYASTSGTPVQRWAAIPGTDAAGHVFTPYPDEQAAIQASGKWRLEDSAAFFSGGGVDLWRAFNPYTGQHLFSTNRVEEITPLTQLTGPATWVLEAPSGLFVAGEGRQPFSGDGVTNA